MKNCCFISLILLCISVISLSIAGISKSMKIISLTERVVKLEQSVAISGEENLEESGEVKYVD